MGRPTVCFVGFQCSPGIGRGSIVCRQSEEFSPDAGTGASNGRE